jgi:hypothetical protein
VCSFFNWRIGDDVGGFNNRIVLPLTWKWEIKHFNNRMNDEIISPKFQKQISSSWITLTDFMQFINIKIYVIVISRYKIKFF